MSHSSDLGSLKLIGPAAESTEAKDPNGRKVIIEACPRVHLKTHESQSEVGRIDGHGWLRECAIGAHGVAGGLDPCSVCRDCVQRNGAGICRR